MYGRDEKSFDKEKNRTSLMQSYRQREQVMRSLAKRTGNKTASAFDATAFGNLTFREAAMNDILLNTVFLANPESDREQFQREKNDKYIDFLVLKKQVKRSQDEPDEMDLYLARLEALDAGHGHQQRKTSTEENRDKALAQTGAMMLFRGMQQ